MAPSAVPTLARRAVAGLMVTSALVLAVPAAAQEPPPTTTGVLVPGDTTATTQPAAPAGTGGPGTTTSTTEAPDEEDEGLLDLDANEKVWVIVGGLVLVAILLSVLTVVYWRHTQPDRTGVETRAERRERKRREKAAKADEADEADEKAARPGEERHDDQPDDRPVGDGAEPERPQTADGPLDLEELLAAPDPSRSVFGDPDDTPR